MIADNMIADYAPQRIADRMEIQDRVGRFSRAVDRKDWDLALSVYHDDAADHHGIYDGDAAGFIEFTKRRHETVLLSMHYTTNMLIDFLGPDDALVETYCFAWQALSPDNKDVRASIEAQGSSPEGPLELLMISRYIDHFTRRGGAWKIQERAVVYESSMKVTPDATGPDVSAIMTMGQRDQSDALWQMRAKIVASSSLPATHLRRD